MQIVRLDIFKYYYTKLKFIDIKKALQPNEKGHVFDKFYRVDFFINNEQFVDGMYLRSCLSSSLKNKKTGDKRTFIKSNRELCIYDKRKEKIAHKKIEDKSFEYLDNIYKKEKIRVARVEIRLHDKNQILKYTTGYTTIKSFKEYIDTISKTGINNKEIEKVITMIDDYC